MFPVLSVVDLDRTHGTNRLNLQPSTGRYVPPRMTQASHCQHRRCWTKRASPCHAFDAVVQIRIRAARHP
jgi:hypothetical protein